MGASDNKIIQFSDLKTYNNKVKQYVQANKGSTEKTTLADLGIVESAGNINMLSDILDRVYYPYTNGQSMVYTRDISFTISSASAGESIYNTYVGCYGNYKILGYSIISTGSAVSTAAMFYPVDSYYHIVIQPIKTLSSDNYPITGTITIAYSQIQS